MQLQCVKRNEHGTGAFQIPKRFSPAALQKRQRHGMEASPNACVGAAIGLRCTPERSAVLSDFCVLYTFSALQHAFLLA